VIYPPFRLHSLAVKMQHLYPDCGCQGSLTFLSPHTREPVLSVVAATSKLWDCKSGHRDYHISILGSKSIYGISSLYSPISTPNTPNINPHVPRRGIMPKRSPRAPPKTAAMPLPTKTYDSSDGPISFTAKMKRKSASCVNSTAAPSQISRSILSMSLRARSRI
jgi:hypothetical protein